MRERLKDRSDAIANAQIYSSLSRKDDEIDRRLKETSDTINIVYLKAIKARVSISPFGEISFDLARDDNNRFAIFRSDSTAFEQFIDDLQCNLTDHQQLQMTEDDAKQKRERTSEVLKDVTAPFMIQPMSEAFVSSFRLGPHGNTLIDRKKFDSSTNQLEAALQDVENSENALLGVRHRCTAAEEVNLQATRSHYEGATYASYFLYGLGWTLGLIGQLNGRNSK